MEAAAVYRAVVQHKRTAGLQFRAGSRSACAMLPGFVWLTSRMSILSHTPPGIAPTERVDAVDVLRGFALLGIFVVNLTQFASGYQSQGLPDPRFTSPWDQAADWLVRFAFEGKFYLLFTFLFGYSFMLSLRRSAAEGARFERRFLRRLLALAGLGAAHACLFYPGDALLPYALLGLLLFLWRGWTVTGWMVVGGGLWLGLSAVYLLIAVAPWDGEGDAALLVEAASRAQEMEAALRAGWLPTLRENLVRWGEYAWGLLLFQGPMSLAMFLAGAAAARAGVLSRGWRVPAAVVWVAAAIGVAGALYYAEHGEREEIASLVKSYAALVLTAPALSAALAAGLLAAARWAWGRRLHAWLAPAGRMTLTLYLMQSVVGALVFTGWGAAAVGQWGPAAVLGLAVFVFVVQLGLATWWLRHHREGPMEAALRRWTRAGEGVSAPR